MTRRILVTLFALVAVASSFASQAAAQDQAQIDKCQGGWETEAKEKVTACTALIDGKQLKGADVGVVYYLR